MPVCLAIDTSTRHTGLALQAGGALELRRFAPQRNAGELLLPAIHELLAGCGLAAQDLDVIVLANGPGSFTGLRIGLATAKGLAFGGRAALVPVSTLEVLAWQAPTRQGHVFPLMDARRGEVFSACWRRQGESLLPVDEVRRVPIPDLLASLPDDALLLGPSLLEQRAAFLDAERHPQLAEDPDCQLALPWLLRLGERRWERQGGEDPDSLEPDYLFDFQPTPGKVRA
ncbi:MAG: tRNA (adenosine(37)-N6)-threonylcarbamoyltransferase complex dimerization subunit type 1 TsaB [Candidatus Delongbacteria bacterium]